MTATGDPVPDRGPNGTESSQDRASDSLRDLPIGEQIGLFAGNPLGFALASRDMFGMFQELSKNFLWGFPAFARETASKSSSANTGTRA